VTRLRAAALFFALTCLADAAACRTDFENTSGSADGGPGGGGEGGASFTKGADFCKSDAAPMPFLACDGFDQSTTFGKQWSPDENGIGSITIDNKDSRSAPNSLFAQVPMHAGKPNPYHQLALSTPMGSGSFAIEFDFKATLDLAATDPSGNKAFACILEINTDMQSNAQVCFGVTYFGMTIETYDDDGGTGSAHVDVAKTPPLDAWHHVRITWSFSPSGSIAMELDGTMAGATAPARTVPPGNMTGNVSPEVGLDSSGSIGDSTVRIDNVVLTQL
jgi:hypothetical protein